jgi:DNA-binding transcriptional LysR family regulator
MFLIGNAYQMNLTFVSYFLAVAEAGHFTRAAERLNVTQPTLSAGIARLEEALAARLFERRRGVALTDAGRRFLPQARTMLDAWGAARADLREITVARHPLRLGVFPTLPDRIVLTLAQRLTAAGRVVDLVELPPEALQTRLQRGQLDAALTILRDGAGADTSRTLHREAYVVVLPPGHALAGRNRAGVGELTATPFVLRQHCEVDAEARRLFAARGSRPPVAARTASDARARALVEAGIGACLMPESLIDPGAITIAVNEVRLERRIGLLLRAGLGAGSAERLHGAVRGLPWKTPS